MTTTPIPSPDRPISSMPIMKMIIDAMTATDESFDDFIAAIVDFDDIDAIFTPAAIESIMLSFDLCPIHRTDLDACADDELTECEHFRSSESGTLN